MGNIYIVMGKSASGKDTIYNRILNDKKLGLKRVVSYTTRPIRTGETNGVEYNFVSIEEMNELIEKGTVIERRVYPTILGDWFYFTVNDGQVDLNTSDYIVISTLEGYEKIRDYYGEDRVFPIYIETSDKDRLLRSIKREATLKKPNYSEVCRRYLADEADFSIEKLEQLHIKEKFSNDDLEKCVKQVKEKIWSTMLTK